MTKKKDAPRFETKIRVEDNTEAQAVASIEYIFKWGDEALASAPLLADIDREFVKGCIETLKTSFLDLARTMEPLSESHPKHYEAAFQQISKLALSAHGIGTAVGSSAPGRHHARSLHAYKMREAGKVKQAKSPDEIAIREEIERATKEWDGKSPAPYRVAADICDALATRGVERSTDAIYDRLTK